MGSKKQRNLMTLRFSEATVTQMRALGFKKPKEFDDFRILRYNSHTDEDIWVQNTSFQK